MSLKCLIRLLQVYASKKKIQFSNKHLLDDQIKTIVRFGTLEMPFNEMQLESVNEESSIFPIVYDYGEWEVSMDFYEADRIVIDIKIWVDLSVQNIRSRRITVLRTSIKFKEDEYGIDSVDHACFDMYSLAMTLFILNFQLKVNKKDKIKFTEQLEFLNHCKECEQIRKVLDFLKKVKCDF